MLAAAAVACNDATPPREVSVLSVSFQSVAVPGTSAATSVLISAELYLPDRIASHTPIVVLLSSSSGIQEYRERYYARTFSSAGVAVLVVDSFGSRGVTSAVEDQSAVTSYQMEADAFGALAFLAADPRTPNGPVVLMGVSKGGTAALNSAILIRETWRGTSLRFDAHIAISPDCTVQHLSAATTGAPILLVLAELDDYAAAAPCLEYAPRIQQISTSRLTLHQIMGAHHGWERPGETVYLATAENFSLCRGVMDDNGRISIADSPVPLTSAEYLAWARANCVTRGAHAGGATVQLRDSATAILLNFLHSLH